MNTAHTIRCLIYKKYKWVHSIGRLDRKNCAKRHEPLLNSHRLGAWCSAVKFNHKKIHHQCEKKRGDLLRMCLTASMRGPWPNICKRTWPNINNTSHVFQQLIATMWLMCDTVIQWYIANRRDCVCDLNKILTYWILIKSLSFSLTTITHI